MPTASRSVSNYDELAKILGADRSVFGIRVVERDQPGALTEFKSLQGIAAFIAAAFHSQHPGGPIYLLGYSFGGPLAVEVACQLVQRGQPVSLVAIIDQ